MFAKSINQSKGLSAVLNTASDHAVKLGDHLNASAHDIQRDLILLRSKANETIGAVDAITRSSVSYTHLTLPTKRIV